MSLALVIGLTGAGGVARAAEPDAPSDAFASQSVLFGPDDLLWFEVRVGNDQIAESMDAYASRAGVFLPLGQFSRVLDLSVGVFPAQARAEGWILSRDRRLIVDLEARTARIGDRLVVLGADQAQIFGDEIYLRADLIEQLLPVRLTVDTSAQVLRVQPTETLPFQSRLERRARAAGLDGQSGAPDIVRLEAPYQAFSPPVFDVNAGGLITRDGTDSARRFDVRAAGDLAWGTVQTFAGSNDEGELSDVRLSWSRKDPDNRALGRFGGTRVGFGDVFTPSMPIGVAGLAGRGVYYSSASLEALDIATPLNLRGELALGEEVELYVNEVLQAAQSAADQGRYEFLDVPLTHGLNTVRLIFYSPDGRTREVVRRINFGAGQVEPGRLVVRFGAVEQGRALISVGDSEDPFATGALRLALQADYGLGEALTVTAGLGLHDPTGEGQRMVGLAGLRGSLGGAALQFDLGVDDLGGSGATGGASARLFGASVVARHSEYRGGFIDETRQLRLISALPLLRATDLRADWQVRLPSGPTLPLSLDARRLEHVDGEAATQISARMGAPVGRFYASNSLTWEKIDGAPDGGVLFGATDLTTLVSSALQFRGGLSYELSPEARVVTAFATADLTLNDRQTLRVGAVRVVETGDTSLQAASLWRTRAFDVALNGAYETDSGEWRVGLQFGASFGFDPERGRYAAIRPGAATGGAARLNVFVDDNGDGRRQVSEEGVPGVALEGPGGAVTTDAGGHGSISGLGDAAKARLRIDLTAVEDPFLAGGPTDLEATPRPGHTIQIDYPMTRTAEVQAVAEIVREEGGARPLSALDVELVSADGARVLSGRTDHAGLIYFEGVRPGSYSLRLAGQAGLLGLEMVEPLTATVGPMGGFTDAGRLRVRRQASPAGQGGQE